MCGVRFLVSLLVLVSVLSDASARRYHTDTVKNTEEYGRSKRTSYSNPINTLEGNNNSIL